MRSLATAAICGLLLILPASALGLSVPPPALTLTGLPTAQHPVTDVQMSWTTGTGVPAIVTAVFPGSTTAVQAAYGNSGQTTLTGIRVNLRYVFVLRTVGLHDRALIVATLAGGHLHEARIHASWIPPTSSATENRLLQLLPAVIAALMAVLIVGYVRSLRARPA